MFSFSQKSKVKSVFVWRKLFLACLSLYYVLDIVKTKNYVGFVFKRTGTPFSRFKIRFASVSIIVFV